MRKNFGEILKAARTAQYLSINQLSETSGVSTAHISRLENELRSVPKPETIKKLAAILGNYEELMEAAGYIKSDNDQRESQAVRETAHTQGENSGSLDYGSVPEGARRIIDSLARTRDLDDEDFDIIADQVERLIAYAKKKRNTPPGG